MTKEEMVELLTSYPTLWGSEYDLAMNCAEEWGLPISTLRTIFVPIRTQKLVYEFKSLFDEMQTEAPRVSHLKRWPWWRKVSKWNDK